MTEPPAKRPRGRVVLRFFIAHGLSYPIATAWAFASVPALVVGIASRVGTTLDDAAIAHEVLVGVAWPTAAAFALAHVAGIVWGRDRDETRGRRRFVVAMAVLFILPALGGGVSWIWLMTR
jgi:MFS family permease